MHGKQGLFDRPWVCLGLGLLVFPIGKLLIVPNLMFNFIVTLVHETGHAAAAWFMGMPAIPKISLAGDGGVTQFWEQRIALVVLVMAGLAYGAFHFRDRKPAAVGFIAVLLVYPFLAFTRHHETLAIAGGVLFEIAAAAYCFNVCLRRNLKRPFERPLYAMIGWWLVANRTMENVLMLTDTGYRAEREIIDSTLAAGLTHDLMLLPDLMGISAEAVLVLFLIPCLLVVPACALHAWWKPRVESLDEEDPA